MPGLGNCSREIGLMSDLGVGSGKPALVLLHPFLLSGNVWQDVVPLLSSYHQVFTPTLLGHRGGPPVQRRPVTIWDVIDAAEEYLNEHGLQRPHLVGNSAGGFVALELARRGRAATVCALSPAGFCAVPQATGAELGETSRAPGFQASSRRARAALMRWSRTNASASGPNSVGRSIAIEPAVPGCPAATRHRLPRRSGASSMTGYRRRRRRHRRPEPPAPRHTARRCPQHGPRPTGFRRRRCNARRRRAPARR